MKDLFDPSTEPQDDDWDAFDELSTDEALETGTIDTSCDTPTKIPATMPKGEPLKPKRATTK